MTRWRCIAGTWTACCPSDGGRGPPLIGTLVVAKMICNVVYLHARSRCQGGVSRSVTSGAQDWRPRQSARTTHRERAPVSSGIMGRRPASSRSTPQENPGHAVCESRLQRTPSPTDGPPEGHAAAPLRAIHPPIRPEAVRRSAQTIALHSSGKRYAPTGPSYHDRSIPQQVRRSPGCSKLDAVNTSIANGRS